MTLEIAVTHLLIDGCQRGKAGRIQVLAGGLDQTGRTDGPCNVSDGQTNDDDNGRAYADAGGTAWDHARSDIVSKGMNWNE